MTGRITGSMNGNGDDMQKPKRKIHTILLGTIILLVIIFINSHLGGIGGEKGKKEESREFAALEEALMKIEGIGEVSLYFHYENGESTNPLSDYFSLSTASAKVRKCNCKAFLSLRKVRKTPNSKRTIKNLVNCPPVARTSNCHR